ncbi:MAG: cytochrome [Alphaproteobacteria bacterium]|jgi:membrane protein YqaA with SNARE-associated domain|nr:cytochrome [Alphaproteobacteria bacterium]
MFRGLYDWTLRLAHHRNAIRSMAVVSFAESSFFPIPPDVVLVPVVLANRDRAYTIAGICTIASVLGGVLGYLIGYALMESVGAWLVAVYGMDDGIRDFRQMFDAYGAWIILAKGLTPIPFKLITIASGIAQFSFGIFIVAATITRAFRFYLIAFLLKRFGEPVQSFIERRLTLVGWGVLIALFGGFAAVALL